MGVQAVVVRVALDLEARHVGVALEALLAGAHRLVVDDTAEGVLAARARIFADAIDAGVRLPTLVVCPAACQDGGQGLAARVVVAHIAVGT